MAIAEIHVTLKPTLLDAQGTTVLSALKRLGHSHAQNVRIGKYITVEYDDTLPPAAVQAQLELACRDLLANPVIEDYRITLPGGAPDGITAPIPAATGPAVVATDTVPNPQPLSSVGNTTPGAQPATFSAARISAPQTLDVPAAQPATSTAIPAHPEQLSAPIAAAATVPVTADPFSISYATYTALSADDRLALQGRAWREHGAWILGQLEARRALWLLCVGQEAVESGDSLDSYPSDARLTQLGTANDLIPWVFTRPPQS